MPEDSMINKTYQVTPTKIISRSNSFGTLASDHAIVSLNMDTQLCTFTFFQTHFIGKIDERGIVMNSIEEEMVMEVKMPFRTAFSVAMYIASMVKEMQGKPYLKGVFFGPVAVQQDPKPNEEKKT
ncbi:MAG: hypothetical protein ABSB89_10355 [Candidatus Bathyarchaeia archaeon]|jgi:hypothetical protein